MLDGFNRHYRLFSAPSRRAPSSASRRPTGTASSAPSASASSSTTCASTSASARLQRNSRPVQPAMDVWQQVKLHYIGLLTDHHQPELAETFFNSVTTKILHRTLFPQRLHLRAAGRQHRVHRERRTRRAADLPRLLPHARQPARDAAAHRRQLPAAARLRGPGARHRRACWTPCAAAWAACGCAPTSRSRCCPACSSATRAPMWSARSSTAFTECPFALPILHNKDGGQAGHRRRAVWRGRPADAVQLRAGLLHGRHGDPQRLRAVPAQPDAAQAARRALQRPGPAEAGQERCSTATSSTTCATAATSSASPPASRAW
jgi:isocitrate dehydrogenase kinase/phosphatase